MKSETKVYIYFLCAALTFYIGIALAIDNHNIISISIIAIATVSISSFLLWRITKIKFDIKKRKT